MIKKSFLLSILIPVILASLLVTMPDHAHAGWFGEKAFAATIGSFFSKIQSFFTGGQISQETSSAVVRANCIPPVPPKPAGIDSGSKYGSLTITPEISTAGPNNIITISATTNLDPTWNVGFSVPIGTDKDDLIDWSPKESSAIKFNQFNNEFKKGYLLPYGTYGWGVVTDKIPLSRDQSYWVKIRTRHSTIPERAKNATDADGWRKIQYSISNSSNSSQGTQGIYVGREQKPSLITTIPNYSPTAHTLEGGPNFLKPFTLVPNEYFEIKTKSLGQPGVITLNVKNAKILGSAQREVKADETVTWKIQPLTIQSVKLLELSLKNTCGEDYFVDPAKSARLAVYDQFTFPVVYDFEKLIANQVDLSIGARGDYQSLRAGSEGIFAAFASLSTKGDTKVPIPNIPITFRAVYADNPKETVKSILFKSYDNEKENAGTFTINTLKDSTGIGSAYVRMLGPKLTEEDAKRGIVLTVTAKRFPELSAQMSIPVVVPKRVVPQSKPPVPTPKPTPVEQSKKIFPQNLVVTQNRALDGLKEGDKITFTAKLVMSDGSTQAVKIGVTWTLIGQVGNITSDGVFSAKLAEAIAEYGEGLGIVTATYKDAGGAIFLGKSPTFKVEAFITDAGTEG